MDWMCKKARCIAEAHKENTVAKGENKYIYTLGMLVFKDLYGAKGKSTYIKLFNTYKEIHIGISGQWEYIISENEEGILKINSKEDVLRNIEALEYKIYDEAYQYAATRNDYILDVASKEEYIISHNPLIDIGVDIDKYAQEEVNKKLSISALRAEYIIAMDNWKSVCKDLKLGGYKCRPDNHPAYAKWQSMLSRAYGASSSKWYDNVTVSESFKYYHIFKEWYLSQYLEEGWELDKDLLVKGNKVYCADRCCFLPKEVNSALAINRSLIPMLAEKYRKVLNKNIFDALLQFNDN